MSGNFGNFGFEDDQHGFYFVVEREPLSSGCLTEAEIDAARERLKTSIDTTALKMKKALKARPRGCLMRRVAER